MFYGTGDHTTRGGAVAITDSLTIMGVKDLLRYIIAVLPNRASLIVFLVIVDPGLQVAKTFLGRQRLRYFFIVKIKTFT